MQTIIIKKQDNNIFDLTVGQDLEICFPKNAAYAVVKTAFFGGGYTTHRYEHTTLKKCADLDRLGIQYEVIDVDGFALKIHPNTGLHRR